MPMFSAKTLVNFIIFKQNKSLNHINQHKTDKLFTINNPSSLSYIHKSTMKLIRLSVTFLTEIFTSYPIQLDRASATTFSEPGIC